MNKQAWLDRAEVMDALRLVPRVFLIIFFCCYVSLCRASWVWYVNLDLTEIAPELLTILTVFPLGLLAALGAMFTSVFNGYLKGGRQWGKENVD